MRVIVKFFDRLEDRGRAYLSRWPIAYAFIGGIGVVLFWRGVWHTTDTVHSLLFQPDFIPALYDIVDGPLSFMVGTVMLLMTGVFVSAFVGSRIIMSGLRGEKKVSEKTEAEVRAEETEIQRMERELKKLEAAVTELDNHHHQQKP